MALSTNIDTNTGIPDGGLLLSEGTAVRQGILDIRDAIVGDSESRWEEVTGSSPTPTHLQSFASTINAGNTSTDNKGFGEHVTLYLADDAGLNRTGDPGARLLRFWRTDKGIHAGILDTVHVDSSTDSADNWVYFRGDDPLFTDFNTFDEGEEEVFLGNDDKDSTYRHQTNSSFQQDVKFFYVLDTEFIWMGAYFTDKTTNFAAHGGYAYHPAPPGNGTVSRDDEPFIWYVKAGSVHESDDLTLYRPASFEQGREGKGEFDSFIEASATDFQERYVYSEAWVKNEGDDERNWYFDSFLPSVQITGAGAFPNVNNSYDFPSVTLSGSKYIVGGSHDSGRRFLVQIT